MIEVKNIYKTFWVPQEVKALVDVSTKIEAGEVVGRRDDQDVADAGQHQHRQGVVHHRLVVHRQQLLAQGQRGRVKPRARAAGENDPFHAEPRAP